MKENVIKEKSFAFALAIVPLCWRMQKQRECVLSRQRLKAGSSIGANIEEAQSGQSRTEFLSKMSIAHTEARGSHYWLRLLRECGEFSTLNCESHLEAADELLRILTSIVRTTAQE